VVPITAPDDPASRKRPDDIRYGRSGLVRMSGAHPGVSGPAGLPRKDEAAVGDAVNFDRSTCLVRVCQLLQSIPTEDSRPVTASDDHTLTEVTMVAAQVNVIADLGKQPDVASLIGNEGCVFVGPAPREVPCPDTKPAVCLIHDSQRVSP